MGGRNVCRSGRDFDAIQCSSHWGNCDAEKKPNHCKYQHYFNQCKAVSHAANWGLTLPVLAPFLCLVVQQHTSRQDLSSKALVPCLYAGDISSTPHPYSWQRK